MASGAGRIDVHCHSMTPAYREAISRLGATIRTPEWTPGAAVELLDRHGIAAAVLSLSVPGTHLGDDAKARALARRCNEEAAESIQRYPSRLGAFATLPIPDVQGACAEALPFARRTQARRDRTARQLSRNISRRPLLRSDPRNPGRAVCRRLDSSKQPSLNPVGSRKDQQGHREFSGRIFIRHDPGGVEPNVLRQSGAVSQDSIHPVPRWRNAAVCRMAHF